MANIISQQFKDLFNTAIDEILSAHGLTVPCKFIYSNSNPELCSNCIFDSINTRSSNIYNGSGPVPFANQTICPVCNGVGLLSGSKEELVNLAVIFDSKYWLNWKYNSIHVTDGMVQTICHSSLLPKIRNAERVQINTNMENYGSYFYTRSSDPELAGFGDSRYIITMWKRL